MPHRRFTIGGAHADAEQTFGGGEQAIEHTRQGEVRAQFFIGETVTFLAHAFSPEAHVPVRQRQRGVTAACAGEGGQLIKFDARLRQGRRAQFTEQLFDRGH